MLAVMYQNVNRKDNMFTLVLRQKGFCVVYENSACELTVITKHYSLVMLLPNAVANSNLISVAKRTQNSLG